VTEIGVSSFATVDQRHRSLATRRETSVCVAAVLLLLGACSAAVAQEGEAELSEQLWLDYNPRWTDRSHREIFGDIGVRTAFGDNEWVRFVVRPGIRGPVGPFRLAGGIGTSKGRRLRLQHYLRLEERFVSETADWTLDPSLRARYRLQVDHSFSGFAAGSDWRLVFHMELFVTLAGNEGLLDEQFRVGVGVGRNVGSVLRVRADFTWEKVAFDFGSHADQLFIRLRVYQGWLRGLTDHDG
jgi:hypothetical protein